MVDGRGRNRRVEKYQRPERDDVEIEFGAVRNGMAEDLITRRAIMPLVPESYDEKAQTVEALISSGADLWRKDARGRRYRERLDLSKADLTTLIGLPVLDGHRHGGSEHVVGVIVSVRREPDGLVALIRLSQADDVASVRTKIIERVLRAVSIGYGETSRTESVENGEFVVTIVPNIRELSVVPFGADAKAIIRSDPMADEHDTLDRPEADPPIETRAAADPTSVRSIARAAGMSTVQADELINRGATSDEVRNAVGAHFEGRSRSTPRIQVIGSHDDPAAVTRRQTDAMVYRMAGGELPADARPYVEMTFRDFAASALERAGVSTRGMSTDELFLRAGTHTTSDFPLIVSNAMNKVALDRFQAAESPLKVLCRRRTLPNFKPSMSVRAGELGRLLDMTESGEFRHTTMAETGESLMIGTSGRAINVSRKLLIDDDQNLVGDMTGAFGDAAAATEADKLAALLLGNPLMRDGAPVFGVGRGNVGTASGITVEALAEAKQAMRLRKGLDDVTLINATPKYLVVGADREVEAEKVLASIQPNTIDDVNPFAGKLTLMVEPRIADGSWFLFADPARLATMQLAYLSSAQGVQIQRAEAWDVLGTKFRAWLDFGCGFVDWRGAHKNAGD